jgi:hypothetical protein
MAVKNIVGFVTTISNQEIVDNYARYIENPNIKIEDKVAYNWLESAVAPFFGGVSRGGSDKLLSDIVIKDEQLLNLFKSTFSIAEDETLELETKFRQTKTAPSEINLPVTLTNISEQLSRTTTTVGVSALSSSIKSTFKKGKLLETVKSLNANSGYGWFYLLKTKDPELYNAFYTKAKFLQINYKTDTSAIALNLFTPINRFKVPPFEFEYRSGILKLSFNNAFEKRLLKAMQDVKPLQLSSLEQLKKDFADLSFGKKVRVQVQGRSSITISVPTGGSIPVTKAKVDVNRAEKLLQQQSSEYTKQKLISGVQWTVLTQKRLGETMLRLGEPEPPELKERSGRFRSSVQVFANYRTMTLQYLYNPLYSSLRKYGYRPDLQVETAIREVAQSLYAQKFNIVRSARV